MKISLLQCTLVAAMACACAKSPQPAPSGPHAGAAARPLAASAIATRLTDLYSTASSSDGSNPTPLAALGP